ncbi:hypothetical protein CFR77_15275 [Komagataeibacter sucrofermentans]|uniref:DUF3825 domain-containing protein n=2 Tax=Komagataeibacter sucrofermentans TaxID=1053551 RepID=A0A318QWZ7_9PROT|nr:hypothetical protein CFR77_15275 [Komagataeibacter sucrofermentans]GBQ43489.1 hypothetical protein AA15973_0002 [Komagataeibacter sucrofermentans DSM 15973]
MEGGKGMTIRQEEILSAWGDPYTNRVVERLNNFAFIPHELLDKLAGMALNENWGVHNYVLKKYLAVQVAWSIEQGQFTQGDRQFYVTAGHLQTRYGTPIYLAFQRNRNAGREPFYLVAVESNMSAPTLPVPPEIPAPTAIPNGVEIVMMHDHILDDNADRAPFLQNTPRVAQMCAVSGAIQWSLNRRLELPYWYYGRMSYVVPLYLSSREDITLAPDLIAPIQVNPQSLLVRTILNPVMPFANARVAVQRHDQLPHWLLQAWKEHAAIATESEIENPEDASS